MDRLGLILAVAAVTYATRLAGFALAGRALPNGVERFLAYVPVAAFAALIAPGIGAGGGELAPRLLGVAAATVAVLRLGRLWSGLAAGLGVYWLARAAMALVRCTG